MLSFLLYLMLFLDFFLIYENVLLHTKKKTFFTVVGEVPLLLIYSTPE